MASYEICTTVSYSLVIFFFGLGMISGWTFEVEVKVSLSSTAFTRRFLLFQHGVLSSDGTHSTYLLDRTDEQVRRTCLKRPNTASLVVCRVARRFHSRNPAVPDFLFYHQPQTPKVVMTIQRQNTTHPH